MCDEANKYHFAVETTDKHDLLTFANALQARHAAYSFDTWLHSQWKWNAGKRDKDTLNEIWKNWCDVKSEMIGED